MKLSTQNLALTALFAALTAVGAFLSIPTPWVSFTLQMLFVLLAGILLGPKCGLLSQVVYIGLGLVGLPIFSDHTGGPGYLLKPSFGFLLGFAAAAWVVGMLTRTDHSPRRVTLACLAGVAVIYACGLPYAALIKTLYVGDTISVGTFLWGWCIMFLPWDAVKVAASVALSQPLLAALGHIRSAHA